MNGLEPAVVATAGRGVVECTGSDRVTFLDAVLSQDIAGTPVGHVAGALFLDAHGSPLALLDVLVLADRILLVAEGAAELAQELARRTFIADVAIAQLTWVVASLRGSGAAAVAATVGVDAVAGQVRDAAAVLVVGRDGGLDLLGDAAAVDEVVAALLGAGAARGDADDLERWRLARGEPAWGREVRPPHLPEEMGLLPTHVHLRKGCYPGQEAVARQWMLGVPRRRLAHVRLTGAASAGWTTGSGRERVEVTSADAQLAIGLAYVPPTAAVGDVFGDEEAGVTVLALVGDGVPIPGHDPAVTRRRDRRGATAP